MKKQGFAAIRIAVCMTGFLAAVSGCSKNDTQSAGASAPPTPPANVISQVQQNRAAEAQGRAADAKNSASSAGAKFRK